MRTKKHEWMCRYAVLQTQPYAIGNETNRWMCQHKLLHKTTFLQRGCFGSECTHNREGTEHGGEEYCWVKCPLARSEDGKCEYMNADGSSRFCNFGEKRFETSTACEISPWHARYSDPLGCRCFEKMTAGEMLLLAVAYVNGCGVVGTKHGKYHFAGWYRDMLKFLGAPPDITNAPLLKVSDKFSKEDVDEHDSLIARKVMKWAKLRMKELKGQKDVKRV